MMTVENSATLETLVEFDRPRKRIVLHSRHSVLLNPLARTNVMVDIKIILPKHLTGVLDKYSDNPKWYTVQKPFHFKGEHIYHVEDIDILSTHPRNCQIIVAGEGFAQITF